MVKIALSPETEAVLDEVIAIRRDLHQHPELAFEEVRTAGVVAEKLRQLGLEPTCGIAKTGVSAVIQGGAGAGPTILLRADMDALPVTEETDYPFRSTVPGKMHACGHDGHTAILLGVAEALQARHERLRGQIKLVFQPAEETPGGALPMIKEGVLTDPDVDCCFGLHLWADLPTGTVGLRPGPVMAASDKFEITVRGSGGHAAMPANCVDPVVVAAHLVTAIQSIVSRNLDALDAAVVSITQFHAGETFNVIPDSATLGGTVRTFDALVREKVVARLRELVETLPRGFGASGELRYQQGYPVTRNDPGLTARVSGVASELVGVEQVVELRPILGAEDFAYFLQEVPGCFFMVGIANEEKGTGAPHHNPRFAVDEDALGIGVELMLRLMDRLLG